MWVQSVLYQLPCVPFLYHTLFDLLFFCFISLPAALYFNFRCILFLYRGPAKCQTYKHTSSP